VEAQSKAPALYPEHLTKLATAQNATIEALNEFTDLQAQAQQRQQDELQGMQATYADRASQLSRGRLGADFQAEANALRQHMAIP